MYIFIKTVLNFQKLIYNRLYAQIFGSIIMSKVYSQPEFQIIIFTLGQEEYGLPINAIQEIIMPQALTKIPRTPEFVEGVINLRGHIIPIIDAKRKFNISATVAGIDKRIIVIEHTNHTVGLIVDSVSEVVQIKSVDIEAAPVEIEDETDFISGIVKLKERLVILLDNENLFSSHQSQSLQSISKAAEAIRKQKETVEALST